MPRFNLSLSLMIPLEWKVVAIGDHVLLTKMLNLSIALPQTIPFPTTTNGFRESLNLSIAKSILLSTSLASFFEKELKFLEKSSSNTNFPP